MTDAPDAELLDRFARNASEPAFAALVDRHIGLVHSVALRHTASPQHAQDITQAVFIILARKAGSLGRKTVLSGWLYHTARLTAANWQRAEARRVRREQEAFMQSTLEESTPDTVWRELSPQLDAAMARLSASDRDALVLRYFQNQSLAEVGAALGIEERAAQKRVVRALEKLRGFFSKRGLTLSALAIAGAVSAHSVSAAPEGLAQAVTATAALKGAVAGGSTLTLVKGALKLMAWTKAKTAMVVAAGVLLAAGTTVLVEKAMHLRLSATDLSWVDDPHNWEMNSDIIGKLPPVFILRPTRFPNSGGNMMFGTSVTGYYKHMARNVDVRWLVASAYGGYSQARCVFPSDLPGEHYDLMFTLPEDYQKRMKAELTSRFGLTAHPEKRVVDVWLLQVKNSDAPGLKNSTGNDNSWIGSQYEAKISGLRISDSIGWLEETFGRPILNQTGLTGRYDVDLKWKPNARQSKNDALRQALLDQLGLELVPSREPVEMLIIQRAK